MSNLMNILPVRAGILSRTEKGQTDGQRNLVNLRHLSQFYERASKRRTSIPSWCLELAFLTLFVYIYRYIFKLHSSIKSVTF